MTGALAGLLALALGFAGVVSARRVQARFMAGPASATTGTGPPDEAGPRAVPPGALVAVRLAGFEAWKLLVHPVLLVGLGLSAILFLGSALEPTDLAAAAQDSGVVLVPFAWAAMIAANLGALRSRRDGADELISSLPSTPHIRTLGHLLSGFAAAGVGVALLLLAIANEVLLRDAFGTPNLGMLGVGPLIVLGGCFLGVLTARWVPSVIVGILLVIATFAVEGVGGSSQTSPARWLQFWVQVLGEDAGHPFPGPSDWHVLYLVGLVAIGAFVALARHGLTRNLVGFGAVALLVAGVAGVAQTRPLSDAEVRRQVALLTRAPAECDERDGVRYCVHKNRNRISQWQPVVAAVLARVPEQSGREPLLVSEREPKIVSNRNCTPTPLLDNQAPRVRAAVDPGDVWTADGAVHPGREWPWDSECNFTDHGLVLSLQVGAWAVGLPPSQAATEAPCRADHQARSVLALWLAGQSDPGAPRAIGDLFDASWQIGLGVAVGFDWATWPNWGVAWADTDMALALALLERPADEVARIVSENWSRLIDPSTPAAEFAAMAGVAVPRVTMKPPEAEHSHSLGRVIELTDEIVGSGLPSCP